MATILRDKYCINMSKLIRKFIRETYEENVRKNENK